VIEVLMQVRKDKYKDNPTLPEGIHLVEEEQITHEIQLEENSKASVCVLSATPAIFLNSLRAHIFRFDPNYLGNDERYKAMKAGVLGEGSSDDESGSEESDSEGDDEGMLGRLVPFLLPY
jgi:pre-mRNA-splicing factor CWC22